MAPTFCSGCGAALAPGRRFCPKCGRQAVARRRIHAAPAPAVPPPMVDAACPDCGGGVMRSESRCPACGSALDWHGWRPDLPEDLTTYRRPVSRTTLAGILPGAQVVVIQQPKSAGLAFLLALLFGPLGMLYSTVAGALIMLVVGIPLIFLTGILGALFVWVISIFWSTAAASGHEPAILPRAGQNRLVWAILAVIAIIILIGSMR